MRQKNRSGIVAALLAVILVLAGTFSARAEKVKQPKAVWVLMLMENQGATVHVGGVYHTQAEAQAAVKFLPKPVADRVEIAVPSTLYPEPEKAHKGGDR